MEEMPVVTGKPGDQIFFLVVTQANNAFVVVKLPWVVGDPAK